jgi:hypothetical protein
MSDQHEEARSVDPNLPHGFVERMNVPFAVPKAVGGVMGSAAPEIPFRRESIAEECAICRKMRSDHIHEASELAADPERWPL